MDRADDLFRDLCENANDLIQSVSPEGRVVYANRAWRELLGYAEDEIGDLLILDVIHPDSIEHCRQALQQVLAGSPLERVAFAFQARNGRRIEVEGSTTCRREGERVVGTCGFFWEATRQKEVRQELDQLFNLSLDLLCIAGTDGFFKQINPAFGRVLGYSPDELLSTSYFDFVHPEDRPGTLAAVERLAQGYPVVDFENRYRAKDGTYRWLSWRSAPVPERGLIYAVARDVSELRRIEGTLARQAQELTQVHADLEQFAYAASHDLRAPLRAVANLTAWIEEDLGPEVPEAAREHMGRLKQRVRRMEVMIEELLEYYRAGQAAQETSRVDVGLLLEEIVSLMSPPPEFRVEADGELPVIQTVRSALGLVLRNLVGNAIKHHDRPDGRVAVGARRTDVGYEFTVSDDGPGIVEADQARIFGIFQTLKSRDRVEGTGIGLALVKRVVERYDGRVTVASTGRGTTFRFTWPAEIVPGASADA